MFIIHEEIRDALAGKNNIVALESTVISHGLPWPENYETALKLDKTIRDEGAVPALIALLDGFVHVGLDNKNIQRLTDPENKIYKINRRDIAAALAQKLSASTTVSATMFLASKSKIKIFATGGIGGVHRGAELSMDISADLEELAKTPVAVVCAGAKSILDIEKTLEVLESKGVPVWGFNTNYFPEFYCTSTKNKIINFSSLNNISQALCLHWSLELNTGVVIAQNIPEEYKLDSYEINNFIEQAIKNSQENNITGKDLTPYLLQDLSNKTKGQSLAANKALLLENARLAARIASQDFIFQAKR